MTELRFTVPAHIESIRVQDFLRKQCGVSRTLLISLKKNPVGLTANGVSVRTIDILSSSDEVVLRIPEDEYTSLLPENTANLPPLDILFEDSHLLILNKPPGLPVHPSNGHRELALSHSVIAYLHGNGEHFLFRPVNRLDKDTSGIIIAAKNKYAACLLTSGTEKNYFAICEGDLTGSGTISLPIHIKPGHNIQREAGGYGKPAVTHWETVGHIPGHTLLKLHLETGRTHQIRVHLSAIGHPLAGDDMYGGSLQLICRQALHCGNIRLIHPVTKEPLSFTATLPDDIQKLLTPHVSDFFF